MATVSVEGCENNISTTEIGMCISLTFPHKFRSMSTQTDWTLTHRLFSPGAKWHILAEPGNVSVKFFLDGLG